MKKKNFLKRLAKNYLAKPIGLVKHFKGSSPPNITVQGNLQSLRKSASNLCVLEFLYLVFESPVFCLFWQFWSWHIVIEIRAHHELTRRLIRICANKFPQVSHLNRSGTCGMTDHLQITDTCRYPQVSTDTC